MKIISRLEIFQRLGKCKSVIYSILRKFVETGSCEAKKPSNRPKKTTATDELVMNQRGSI